MGSPQPTPLQLTPCCVCMQEQRADVWDGINVLTVMAGGASDDLRYLKSVSLHLWLFGYEITGVPVDNQHIVHGGQ